MRRRRCDAIPTRRKRKAQLRAAPPVDASHSAWLRATTPHAAGTRHGGSACVPHSQCRIAHTPLRPGGEAHARLQHARGGAQAAQGHAGGDVCRGDFSGLCARPADLSRTWYFNMTLLTDSGGNAFLSPISLRDAAKMRRVIVAGR
jgi:hypothetical protein